MSKASEAIKAEAEATDPEVDDTTPKPIPFEFDGHEYAIAVGQPSPKAVENLAEYVVNDSELHAPLFIRDIIGRTSWDEWCERHRTSQIADMVQAINGAFTGN